MKLYSTLKRIDSYPFHMPGHKRNSEYDIPSSEIDNTEIKGLDNLHNPEGVISDLQKRCAEVFGYNKTIISVNGSTCCVLSAISALCNKGDRIIIARNCHKSVYNACFINELKVTYIEPEFIEELGAYGAITQEAIDKAITNYPDAKAVVITSPTYEGVVSNVSCQKPLIIDAAHGAHFGFADYLPKKQNGDIIINSIHKTLPSLTQTALIHINNEKFYLPVKKYMDIFESSSPSYVLLSSVEKCIDFLEKSENAFNEYKDKLHEFYSKVNNLKNIRIYKSDDITRIVLYSNCADINSLAACLRENGIEPEAITLNYIILISTVCDTKKGFDLLINALIKADKICTEKRRFIKKIALPKKAYEAYEIKTFSQTEISKARGKICADYIYCYPPGIPIIVPGEVINEELISLLTAYKESDINIISDSDIDNNKILTKQ